MNKCVAAIDQGMTSTRCLIFNHCGEPIGGHQLEHEQIYPEPGWVEHDPLEIWKNTRIVIQEAARKTGVTAQDIVAVGITNQRETPLAWDRLPGQPFYNAIVWQDTRTESIINMLAEEGGIDRFREMTGLPLATYFSGPKIKWMRESLDGLSARGDARGLYDRGDCFPFGRLKYSLAMPVLSAVRAHTWQWQ